MKFTALCLTLLLCFCLGVLIETKPLTSLYAPLLAEDLHFPDEPPPEPLGYRMQNYRAPVPQRLTGAITVSNQQAKLLHQAGTTIFIDVMPFTSKPPSLPDGVFWQDKPRHNIAGSVWLANVGYGRLPPEMQRYFEAHLERLTKHNKAQPLLFYCQENCWMSWNAAKRALAFGYSQVYWYPQGTEGWVRAGGALVFAKVEPLPNLTRPY